MRAAAATTGWAMGVGVGVAGRQRAGVAFLHYGECGLTLIS
jgi:hypothetical protein